MTSFGSFASAGAVVIQTDGKLVAAGYGGPGDFALARYDATGALDPGFGSDGKVTTAIGASGSGASALVSQKDGKLVAAGFSDYTVVAEGNDLPLSRFAIDRYNANGSLDPSFGRGGKVTTAIGVRSSATALAMQKDGKFVAAGFSEDNGSDRIGDRRPAFALARYNANGSLDPSFGSGGKVTTRIGLDAVCDTVVIRADGKIVTAGWGNFNVAGWESQGVVLARYNANGTLDPSFGRGGEVTTAIGDGDDDQGGYFTLAIQKDGKLIAAGWGSPQVSGNRGFVLRYNANGSLDRSFGRSGKVTTVNPSGADALEPGANALAIEEDGKIVTAGSASHGFVLIRYKTHGSLDRSFGSGGKVTTVITLDAEANALAIEKDGKIVAVGYSGDDDGRFALARYLG